MIHAHSGLRWIILILLLVSIFNSYKKWKTGKAFTSVDNKLTLASLIFVHIQFLLGIDLFFTSSKVMLSGMDMSNSVIRFFTVEHSIGMLLAIVAITVGRIQSKKINSDPLKHKKIFVMYLIGLILILIAIPWPFRNLGAQWF